MFARLSAKLEDWTRLQRDGIYLMKSDLAGLGQEAEDLLQSTASRVYELRSRVVPVKPQVGNPLLNLPLMNTKMNGNSGYASL